MLRICPSRVFIRAASSAAAQQQTGTRIKTEIYRYNPEAKIYPLPPICAAKDHMRVFAVRNTCASLPSATLVKTYTFPTPEKFAIKVPTIESILLEKTEPLSLVIPLIEPHSDKPELIAGPRMLVIRRKKMNKHKRRKRFKRDYFKYQTYHQAKKAKAEKIFRQKMGEMINDLNTFDPLEHVKDTMRRARREWTNSLAVSGRKKYPHWSELMQLEELYGLEKDVFIYKKCGRPSPEDEAQIQRLRVDYFAKYTRKGRTSEES